MHILIIPSEFYDDEKRELAGIFQRDQANVLLTKNHKVGILSIKPKFTFYELIYSTFKRKIGYLVFITKTEGWYIFFKTFFLPISKSLKTYTKNRLYIVRYTGSYKKRVSTKHEKLGDWERIAEEAFEKYKKTFGEPDIIHTHNVLFAGMIGSYLSNKFKVPFILTEHSSAHKLGSFSEVDNHLVREYYNKIMFKYAVSPSLANFLEKKYGLQKGSVGWLPNVVDEAFENEEVAINSISRDKITLLNIASLVPLKQQEYLINSFTKAFKADNNIILEIVGGGPLRSQLLRQIKELKMENRIFLLGSLPRPQVIRKIRNSDLLVHSSEYETFGVVLIEALALGKPVLSTTCGGPECIVNEKNGMLVPHNNEQLFADGMKKMIYNIKKYSALDIKKDLINHFGNDSFYVRLINIYKKVINDYNN